MSTIKRVAAKAGVSIATVSRVINKSSYVALPLQKRVLEAMAALDYQPSALARGLRRNETQSVGVLVPQLDQPFFSSIAHVIEKTLFAHGYRAFLCSAEEDRDKESAYTEMLLRQRVDGLILVPTGHSAANVKRLLQAGVPVVLVDRDLPELEIDRVLCDNFGGSYTLMNYLIELGHRSICVISPSQHSGSIGQRFAGIDRALGEAISQVAAEIVIDDRPLHFEMGFVAAQRLLKRSRPPTALMALNDVIAVGAIHAAWKSGLDLPADLSITGFDDVPLASYSHPDLTTVTQPTYEMGEHAVQYLLQRIQTPELEPRRLVLPTRLTVRNSTSKPRSDPPRRKRRHGEVSQGAG
jgi:LacI family transcriptional regulator